MWIPVLITLVLKNGWILKKDLWKCFLKKKADIIILGHVLGYIYTLVNFLVKLKSLIKKNGVIYIEVPGIKHPKAAINGNLGVQPGYLSILMKSLL
jgi:hypothetical protein